MARYDDFYVRKLTLITVRKLDQEGRVGGFIVFQIRNYTVLNHHSGNRIKRRKEIRDRINRTWLYMPILTGNLTKVRLGKYVRHFSLCILSLLLLFPMEEVSLCPICLREV